MSDKSVSFEENMGILKEACSKLSMSHQKMDDMISSYREGIEAAGKCLALLHDADEELTVLREETENLLKKEVGKDDSEYTERKTETD